MKYFIVILLLLFLGVFAANRLAELPNNEPVIEKNDFANITHPPKRVHKILRTQCYHCHSDETKFPMIAHFAPFDKKYAEVVVEGRKKLNFSRWASYTPEIQQLLLSVAVEQMANKTMPILDIFPQGDSLTQINGELLMHWLAQEGMP